MWPGTDWAATRETKAKTLAYLNPVFGPADLRVKGYIYLIEPAQGWRQPIGMTCLEANSSRPTRSELAAATAAAAPSLTFGKVRPTKMT